MFVEKEDAKQSAYDALSLSDLKETAELVTDLRGPGGLPVMFCPAQQFELWQRFFAAVLLTQHDGLSPSSSSRSKKIHRERWASNVCGPSLPPLHQSVEYAFRP